MEADLNNLSISELKKIKKEEKKKLQKEYQKKLIKDIKKIQKAREKINKSQKPKIKTFEEYFQECIENKTIPQYFRKALERANFANRGIYLS